MAFDGLVDGCSRALQARVRAFCLVGRVFQAVVRSWSLALRFQVILCFPMPTCIIAVVFGSCGIVCGGFG
eukprot:3217879-Lingulodinium_polyedra.AAC.1